VNFLCVRIFAVRNYYAIDCLPLTSSWRHVQIRVWVLLGDQAPRPIVHTNHYNMGSVIMLYISIITLLPFFIEMLQYDWLWSGHMIIKVMFDIPMKLKSELARASTTTRLQIQLIYLRIECILLKFHWGMKALTEVHFQWSATALHVENVVRSTFSYPEGKKYKFFTSPKNISDLCFMNKKYSGFMRNSFSVSRE
jgi:hypothetical protein